MRYLIDVAYLLAAVGLSPVVIYRMLWQKRYRRGWGNRFGKVERRRPERKCIWIHAVSVGEVNATRTLVAELKRKLPDFEIVISSTTDTGFARAEALYGGEHCVFYFPLDLSWVVAKVFRSINPAVCLLMELEVWPNFVATAQRLQIPVVIVNGRITRKSCRRFGMVKPLAAWMFRKIDLVLAQSDEYARRFAAVGVVPERVVVTGSLKYDTAEVTDSVEGVEVLREQLDVGDERVLVAGGTGPGEEKILLDVYGRLRRQFEDLRLVIVPRKPERFGEVAELIERSGFEFVRFSSIKSGGEKVGGKVPVILGDTMGDLRKFYCLADVAFVGRSLVPMGGSDMIEAVALGKCCVFGPHTFNFAQTVEDLLAENGAIQVNNADELLAALRKCLGEPSYAAKIAAAGRAVVKKNQGATQRSVEKIMQLTQSLGIRPNPTPRPV